jgi:hypothetical protein
MSTGPVTPLATIIQTSGRLTICRQVAAFTGSVAVGRGVPRLILPRKNGRATVLVPLVATEIPAPATTAITVPGIVPTLMPCYTRPSVCRWMPVPVFVTQLLPQTEIRAPPMAKTNVGG